MYCMHIKYKIKYQLSVLGRFEATAASCSDIYQQEMNNRTEVLSDKIIAVIQGTVREKYSHFFQAWQLINM